MALVAPILHFLSWGVKRLATARPASAPQSVNPSPEEYSLRPGTLAPGCVAAHGSASRACHLVDGSVGEPRSSHHKAQRENLAATAGAQNEGCTKNKHDGLPRPQAPLTRRARSETQPRTSDYTQRFNESKCNPCCFEAAYRYTAG